MFLVKAEVCLVLRSNVLLDAAGVPHVADMGLARRITPANAASLTGETGAPGLGRHHHQFPLGNACPANTG